MLHTKNKAEVTPFNITTGKCTESLALIIATEAAKLAAMDGRTTVSEEDVRKAAEIAKTIDPANIEPPKKGPPRERKRKKASEDTTLAPRVETTAQATSLPTDDIDTAVDRLEGEFSDFD